MKRLLLFLYIIMISCFPVYGASEDFSYSDQATGTATVNINRDMEIIGVTGINFATIALNPGIDPFKVRLLSTEDTAQLLVAGTAVLSNQPFRAKISVLNCETGQRIWLSGTGQLSYKGYTISLSNIKFYTQDGQSATNNGSIIINNPRTFDIYVGADIQLSNQIAGEYTGFFNVGLSLGFMQPQYSIQMSSETEIIR